MPYPALTTGATIALASACAMLAASVGGVALAQSPSRTLLAVFAHPDDEQVVAPLLARYAREGVRVVLAIATDGQKGVRAHAGIPAGEPLATARAAEARCACERLGIQPPVLMGIEDGALHDEKNEAAAREHIVRLMAELMPQVVVTWGPDGMTGHADHRMISNLVTEVIQRGGKGSRRASTTSACPRSASPPCRRRPARPGPACRGISPSSPNATCRSASPTPRRTPRRPRTPSPATRASTRRRNWPR